MPDRRQLPHLLRLLDDDEADVREAVLGELASFGRGLAGELERMGLVLSKDQAALLEEYTGTRMRAWLLNEWSAWFAIEDEKEKLEAALTLIAEYQDGGQRPGHLRHLLDDLAAEYRALHTRADLRELSRFLFSRKKLSGAQQDYYDPRNSNLMYVIERRRGIPISLAPPGPAPGGPSPVQGQGHQPDHRLGYLSGQQSDDLLDLYSVAPLIAEELNHYLRSEQESTMGGK